MESPNARHKANPQGSREDKPGKYSLALLLAVLVLGIGLILESDSLVDLPRSVIGVAHAQGATSALESLGVPMFRMGIPSTNMWVEGNLLYGEALDPATGKAPFFAYDITTQKVVFVDTAHENIHDHQRNIMVDSEGNAYFGVNANGLAKYDPRTNSVTVLRHKLPNFLRASTPQSASGWIYGASGQSQPTDLFRFNPKQDVLEVLGPSWGYTTSMVLDPTERYFYYVPGAHGGASASGTPVLQYDTQTRKHKVIAFLHPFLEQKTGRDFDGTFALSLDPAGKRLFITMRTYIGTNTDQTRNPGLVVVNIPPQEAPQVVPPRIRFEDVTSASGLGDLLSDSYIHTSSWGDADGDGWLDLFVGTFVGSSFPDSGDPSDKPDPDRLMMYQNGVFQDSGQSSIAIHGRGAGSVFADLDNDGDLDLYISNNRKSAGDEPSHILRNDQGVFTDVTQGSGIDAQALDGRQAGVLDYNNDGLLDLFVLGGFHVPGPTVLLRNKGGFHFEDATATAGLPTDIHGLGLAIGDVTGNGWPDIFVAGGPSRTDQHNYMFIARGDGTYRRLAGNVFDWNPFTQQSEDWVGGAAFADLNRDGRLDLLVGQHFESAETAGAPLRVYMNQGLQGTDPVFSDITSSAGLPKIFTKAPQVEIQDFDNDGWPDLYASVRIDSAAGVEPLIFTHKGNSGNPTFSAPNMVNPYYYPGGPVADFNNDGKLDVLLPRVDTRLLQNTGAPGNWLKVQVDTNAGSNRFGIGAKVKIYRTGTTQLLGYREISASSGFSSSQASTAHFGLGNENFVDVVVQMPFGAPEYRRNSAPANRVIKMPNGPVEAPAHQGLEVTASTGTSAQLLNGPGGLPAHTVASVAPTIDYAIYPLPDYPGVPWSHWGQGILASNGRYYSNVGDHIKDASGNTFLYEYDPITRKLKSVGDIVSAVGNGPGKGGHHAKVHGRINEANDGYIYFTSYWGKIEAAAADPRYEGAALLRYPINTVAAGKGGPPTTDTTPPETSLIGAPPSVTADTTASFSFTSNEAGSSFKCRLDGGAFSGCSSPESYAGLIFGAHTFQVVATDAAGNPDPTPASHTWTLNATPPAGVLITNIVVSNGKTYQGDTLGSGKLTYNDRGYTFTSVPSRLDGPEFIRTANEDKTATGPDFLTFSLTADATVYVLFDDRVVTLPAWLNDGTWSLTGETVGTTDATRRVYQKQFSAGIAQLGGNAMAPMRGAGSNYNVVAVARETTPPETSLDSGPPSATADTTASFSFSSSEAGSSFECRLDNGPLTSCSSPESYTGLMGGAHTFQVVATNAAGNPDPTPASHTWSVDTPPPAGGLITGIVVSNGTIYQKDTLGTGKLTYKDRGYTFTSVPSLLDGQEFIRAANDDKTATVPDFLTFTLTANATVYLLFDDRVVTLPAWLNDGTWSLTGETVGTTDISRRVYQKQYRAGTVQLGGNAMAPMRGAGSNYNVVAVRNN
ncbi:MAG TPA: VCBS repeat-containing protein [Dehalococcoidia bacterium]|nr:VCBS repeat-containing protein [Dehalococcoidia bacterium]